MRRMAYGIGVVAVALMATACGSGDGVSRLDVREKTREKSAELERVHKLQAVRVFNVTTNQYEEYPPNVVAYWFADACDDDVRDTAFGKALIAAWGNFSDTDKVIGPMKLACGARRAIEFSTPNRPLLVLDNALIDKVPYDIQIPPQSELTNAAFARWGANLAELAMYESKNLLLSASGDEEYFIFGLEMTGPLDLGQLDDPILDKTVAGWLGETFATSFDLYTDAMERASQATLASAELWRANGVSEQEAASLEFQSPELSRYAAAGLAVGGVETSAADPPVGFCTARQLSGQGLAALKVLRAAAPSPLEVTGDTLLEDFLNGTLATGSIKERLEEQWKTSFIDDDGDPQDVEGVLGISTDAFQEARDYLAQEIKAYARSADAQLASTEPLTWPRYAATAEEPAARPAVYYETLARGNWRPTYYPANAPATTFFPALEDWYHLLPQPSDFSYHLVNYASSMDAAISTAVFTETNSDIFGTAAATELRAALGPIAARGTTDRTYRVYLWAESGAYALSLLSNQFVHWLRLVEGEDGLACATQGAVESVPCTASQLDEYSLEKVSDLPLTPGADRGGFQYGWTSKFAKVEPATPRVYLVSAKTETAAPGQWEAIVGMPKEFYMSVPVGGPEHDGLRFAISVSPEAREWAYRALQPGKDWCNRGRFECGYWMDDRVPLENELSDDQDDVESSWRHYIQLARAAATEADQLGNEYYDYKVAESEREEAVELREMAQREAALATLEELQDVCGTNIDPIVMLDLLGDSRDMAFVGEPCSADSDCALAGMHCVYDVCLPDLVQVAEDNASTDPELRRIAKCLGDDEDVGFVSVGTEPVCLWYADGNPNRVCEGATTENPCPAFPFMRPLPETVDSGPCGWTEVPPPTDQVAVTIEGENLLQYFDSLKDLPSNATSPLCDEVRNARQQGSPEILAAVRGSDTFDAQKASDLAQQIGFDFRPGWGKVTLNLEPIFHTGDPSKWPCAPADWGINHVDGALFSGVFGHSCTTQEERMQVVDRLMNAVLTLRVVTDTLPTSFESGYLPNLFVPHYVADAFVSGDRKIAAQQPAYPDWFAEFGAASDEITELSFTGKYDPDWWDGESRLVGYSEVSAKRWEYPSRPDALAWRSREGEGLGYQSHDWRYVFDTGTYGWIAAAPPIPVPNRTQAEYDSYHPCRPTLEQFFGGLGIGETANGWYADFLQGASPTNECGVTLSQSEGGFFPLEWQVDMSPSTLKDALELLCEMDVLRTNPARGFECGDVPDVSTTFNLKEVSQFLQCVGASIQQKAALGVLAHFPAAALDALREDSPLGSFPDNGGRRGVALGRLRSALTKVAQTPQLIGHHIKQVGYAIDTLRTNEALAEVRSKITSVNFQSRAMAEFSSCAQVGIDFWNTPMRCAGAVAQIGFARELADLQQDETQLAENLAVTNFRQTLESNTSALEGLAIEMSGIIEGIDTALDELETLRLAGRRALSRAIYQLSSKPQSAAEVTGAMASRAKTAESRYMRARTNAVKMAILAKRAVEQRVGMRLATMHEDLPLVDAPASWEGELCAGGGINYTQASQSDAPVDYSSAFVGEYVTKLENFVESYRQRYAFHEGTDTAVISLRDDLLNIRETCDVPLENRIYYSNDLDQAGSPDVPKSGWYPSGCSMEACGDGECPVPNCVVLNERANKLEQVPSVGDQAINVFALKFGTGTDPCDPPDCGYLPGAALAQDVELESGLYRMSWYTDSATYPLRNHERVNVVDADEDDLIDIGTVREEDGTGIRRYWAVFELPEPQTVRVEIRGLGNGDETEVAGLMLEYAGDEVDPEAGAQMFAATGKTLSMPLPLCEDTDGSTFRINGWKERSINLCADGFSDNCAGGVDAQKFRFWETNFNVNQFAIEGAKMLLYSGFARGNYNYRIESIGVNVVGTGTRACDDQTLASVCYGGGFFPFSLYHSGPFSVRNHTGNDERVYLYDGVVEHARALATERYITNPLSSADQNLMEPFMRGELAGRPLDGNFVLRLWDEPGVDFKAVEDVQIILKYRYWTRNN